MAKGRQTFNRREREKAKKEKADEKRHRRFNRPDKDDTDDPADDPVDEGAVIGQLAALNATFEAGDLEFEDFEQQRDSLLERLTIS